MLQKKKVWVHPNDGRRPYLAFRYVNEEGKVTLKRSSPSNHDNENEEDDDNESPSDEDRIKHLQKKIMTEKDKNKLSGHKEELDSLKKRKDSGKSYLELLQHDTDEENKKDIKQLEDHRSKDEDLHDVDEHDLKDAHIIEADEDEDEDEEDDKHKDMYEDEDDDEDEEDDDPEWKELTKNNKYAKSNIVGIKNKLMKISKGKYGRFK